MTVQVQEDDFSLSEVYDALRGGGAVVVFVGLVRDMVGGDAVTALTLEHYPVMTEKRLKAIRDEALSRWALDHVVIIHRVGRLLPGEQIVVVGCSSSHREAAFEATQFIMDYLKTDAPFWKSEETKSGTSWLTPRSGDAAARQKW